MFCSNCGSKIEDGAAFCSGCGMKIESNQNLNSAAENTADKLPVNETISAYPEETNQNISYQSQDEEKALESDTTDAKNEPVKFKRKRSKKPVFISVALLAVVCVFGFIFKDSVLAAVAPRFYFENILSSTVKDIGDQLKESSNQLYGFDIDNAKEIEYTIGATIDSADDYDLKGIGGTVTLAKSDKDKVFALNAVLNYDEKELISGVLALDDENVSLDIPELFDKCLTIPSKNFGKEWNDSVIGEESDVTLDDELDISYSELFKNEDILTEDSIQEIKKLTKDLIKNAEIDTSKGSAEADGKTVNTRRVNVAVTIDSIEDYLIAAAQVIQDDENIRSLYPESEIDTFDDVIDEICDGIKDLSDYYDDDFVFNADVYKGKIIKLSYEASVEEADISAEISFRDTKNPINDIYGLFEIKADGEKLSLEWETIGNHMPDKDIFSDETNITLKVPGEDSDITYQSSYTLDMNKNTCEGEAVLKPDSSDAKLSISFSGECSNKKGYKLDLDDVEIEYSDYSGNSSSIKGSILLAVNNELTIELPDTSKGLDILKATKDELAEWIEDVSKNSDKFAEEVQSIIYDDYYLNQDSGTDPFSTYDNELMYDDYGFDDYSYDSYSHDDYGYDGYGYDSYGYDDYGYDDYGYDDYGYDDYGYDDYSYDDEYYYE